MKQFTFRALLAGALLLGAGVDLGFPLAKGGDCQTTAVCPETDVNCDNLTDGFDIAVVRNTSNWLLAVGAADEPRADVNGDGVIDGFDIAAIRNTACWLRGGFSQTQLAGNALPSYPHFEYVRAFNENATIEVAIDPTVFPTVVGQTCDIYVTEARTATEWLADGSLVDVTAGGAQTETFAAGGVADNTFVVVDPFDLSGDAGIDVGVGYDVVLDCDQDGTLSGSDFIDGFGNEAGLYVIKDLSTPGPLAVTRSAQYTVTFPGIPTFANQQLVSYPTNIASMGQLPLVVVSHGVGHAFTGYEYLQRHLSSYGYIVMCNANSIGSIPEAANTTQRHTDAILDEQDTILGGVLNGHIDSHRITWIGHSRGGEGVALAYDNLFDGDYVPTHYTVDDVLLVSSIAPTAFQGDLIAGDPADVHDVNYHLFYGGADDDVSGSAGCSQCQSFRLYERATRHRVSTYIHGVGHNDFYCCGSSVASGPALIGREETQKIAKIVWLALVKHYIEGNIPSKDILWRQWETLQPMGVLTTDVIVNDYKDGSDSKVVIDDYQTQSSTAVSSSGGGVTFDVSNVFEGQMRETDGTFTWNPANPMNGMTRAAPNDVTRGFVFDWTVGQQRSMELEVPPVLGDWSGLDYLSFRAAQITHHPETVAELADLTFSVSLEDGTGAASSINIGTYGGGIQELYQRSGGWQDEMETIRIRLTDFLRDGSGLDLSDIAAIRFDFGSDAGSSRGRLGFDDVEVTKE